MGKQAGVDVLVCCAARIVLRNIARVYIMRCCGMSWHIMAAYSTLQDIIVSLGKHVASRVSILQEIARLHEIAVQELVSSLPEKKSLNSGARPKQLSSLPGEW